MKLLGLMAALSILGSVSAFAADEETPPPLDNAKVREQRQADQDDYDSRMAEWRKQHEEKYKELQMLNWRVTIEVGATLLPASSYSVTYDTGAPAVPGVTTHDPSSYCFGLEMDRRLYGVFGLGLAFDYANYPKSDPSDYTDVNLTFMLIPRVAWDLDSVIVWGGVGVGYTSVDLGTPSTPTATTSTSATGSLGSGSNAKLGGLTSIPLSFTWSPRVGVDIPFGKGKYFTGGQAAFYSTAISTGVSGATGAPTASFSRHWSEVSAIIGLRY